MENWFNSIRDWIAEGKLLPAAYFAELDCDAALDSRNEDENFDSHWVRLFDEIERRWPVANVDENLRELLLAIRQESFLAVNRATRSHEIAGYVSDDFDLVLRARLVGLADPLLDHLWSAYSVGRFPVAPL